MRVLRLVAALNIALHLAGLVAAFIGLRPGSPAVPLDDRMAYLASRPAAWALGWALWMLCALALLAFLAVLRGYAERPALASLAVLLGGLGMSVDLLCEIGQITVLPDVASWKPPQPAQFVAWERWLGAGGTVVANGLYSLAVVPATAALRRTVASYAWALAFATFGAGMLMVAAGFTGDPRWIEASVGPTILSFVLWCAAVTWSLSPRTTAL